MGDDLGARQTRVLGHVLRYLCVAAVVGVSATALFAGFLALAEAAYGPDLGVACFLAVCGLTGGLGVVVAVRFLGDG